MKKLLLFKSNSRLYCLLILQLLCLQTFAFQQQSITGIVSDASGALPDVSILIKGTAIRTLSDENGYYSIKANIGDVLVFSHIGYRTQEKKFSNQSKIDVLFMEDIEQLAAVEITGGYYSLAERTKTGNVTKIDITQLDQQVIQAPLEALQGRVAGLEVETRTGLKGQAPIVKLRGQKSLRGNLETQPLYIIDGIPIDNRGLSHLSEVYDGAVGVDPLATLDPSLIESIEILKDADATAIYGSRGANGVIIINTKRGQAGKTKFELQTETGVSWVGKFMELMDTEQYLKMRREAFKNDGITPANSNAPDLLLWDQNQYTDWQKELIGGTAEFQKYQATISGGNDQTSFLLSGGFQKEGTVFPGDFGFQNNNLLANINHRSKNNKLNLNTSINYGYQKSSLFQVGAFFSNMIRLAPNTPSLFDEEGNINWELDEYGNPTFKNPLYGLSNPNIMRLSNWQWNGQLHYQVLKGLEAQVNLGYNHLDQNDQEWFYKKNVNPLNQSFAQSMSNNRINSRKNIVVEPQLNYSVNFSKHRLNNLIGSSFQKSTNTEIYLRGTGYYSESQVGNIALAENNSVVQDEIIDYKYAALYGRIGYSYDNKYHLNLTGRRDGSSRFGEKNRFGNFGAVGVAWDFYKENFIINIIPQISTGKIRGSYGVTGSDNIGDYQYRDTYYSLYVYPNSISKGGLAPSKLHNPSYSWEKNTKLELALDLGLWNDRFLLSSGWHLERSDNQLIGLQLPSITGFTTVQGNFPATIQNTGWELGIHFIPVQNDNWNWNSFLNLTIPKNKLIAFPDLESSSYASSYMIGKSLGIQKLYNYTGIDPGTGKYTFEDINADGVLNNDDQVVITDLSRKFYGGWNNKIQYKSWTLSFLFEFVKQKDKNPVLSIGSPGEFANMSTEVLDRWQNNRPNSKYQAYTQDWDFGLYNYMSSNANITDASFVRMKSVSLNYQIPSSLLSRLKVQQAQIYFKGQNLFTLTPYKGFDPQSGNPISLPIFSHLHVGLKFTI